MSAGPPKPPLPSLVTAPAHKADVLVPLSDVDEGLAASGRSLDLVLHLPTAAVDTGRLEDALGQALEIVPECAGRYVRRHVPTEDMPDGRVRACVLCDNSGAAFRATDCEGPAPASTVTLPQSLWDRAENAQPAADGGPGGVLFRARLLNFVDGQVLTISVAQGLADAAGVALFVKTWACLYRGEHGLPVIRDRIGLEAAVRGFCPRLESEYALLHRIDDTSPTYQPKAAAYQAKPVLVGFVVPSEELEVTAEKLSESCRRQRLIYDSETLSREEVAFALVIAVLGAALPSSMWLDYRETFVADNHFGCARGEIDLDLPRDPAAAAAYIRKKPAITRSRDFWAWKSAQPARPSTSRMMLCSWVGALAPEEAFFDAGPARGFAPGETFWQEWVDSHGKACPSFTLLLPHPAGIQVQAMVPRECATRFCTERECQVWHAQ